MNRLSAALSLALLLSAPAARAAEPPRDPVAAELAGALSELERGAHDARAIVTLQRLAGLEDQVADPGPIAAAYGRVAADAKAHPEVQALARWQLALLDRSRGNLHRSRAHLDRLGFLDGWWIAGPFDDEGKRGHDAVYPPEEAQDPGARFPGKAREVGWRALPAEARNAGFVHLGAAVRPAREVVVYALAVVDAPREERVRLHLGTSGATKLWVNGELAYADPAHHAARLDQAAVAVTLRRGTNRLLLKVASQDGRFGFYARAARLNGDALALTGRPPPWPAPAAGAPARGEKLPTAVEALEARASALEARRAPARERAAAHLDLAYALDLRRAGEARERRAMEEARAAARLAPEWVEARLAAARLEDDGNRRREQLEAAVRAAPRDARALLALAEHHLERRQPERAMPLLRAALAASPAFVAARLAVADAWEAAGLLARARQERRAIAVEHAHVPAAILAAARAHEGEDRIHDAIGMLRTAVALRFDDAAARAALVQGLLATGDLEGALSELETAIRVDPSGLEERVRRAELLASNHRTEEAEAAFAEAIRICPEESELLERRGHARLRAGRGADALADFHAALELRPQQPGLKELVRALEPERERFEQPYVLDARALAAAVPPATRAADAVVLADLRVTRVQPSGLSSTFTQLVVKVNTQRAVDQFRTHSIAWVPGRQELRIERARVLKPDGAAVDAFTESDRDASEPWYRLYYDTRARVIGFPALAPGDVLELSVRRDDVAGENLLSDYFGEVVTLADNVPKLRAEYVLVVPESRKIHAREPDLKGVERTERRLPGALVEHRWIARDVPEVRPEPRMPGWSEVAPFVHVSTYESWDQVARFYWGLVREQLEPNAEVRRTARAIADGVLAARGRPAGGPVAPEDELAVIRAVHAFVVTNTRYVGLEIGIHGYKPYRVDQILERRFGDCKDKASLTHALLASLGIDSRLVLLRMKRLGRVPEYPASLAVFNHAILHVPKHGLWLDGTATWSGTGDLPAEDRGADVLVVNPGGAPWFGQIPEAKPEENRTENRFEVAIAPDGSARLQGATEVRGVQAPGYRRAYQAERERRATFEHAFSRTFPGLQVREVALGDLARLDEPIDLRFSLDLPRFAERQGERLRFLPFGLASSYAESWAPLSTRRHDLLLADPHENHFTFRYTLPTGLRPEALPAPLSLESPYARFDVGFRMERDVLVGEGRVVLRRGRIEAADYVAFRQFAAQLDRALARPIQLVPAAPTAP